MAVDKIVISIGGLEAATRPSARVDSSLRRHVRKVIVRFGKQVLLRILRGDLWTERVALKHGISVAVHDICYQGTLIFTDQH